ncbi:MAG: ATP-binding protein, partial [Alphaproteobacteria bacterium]|nr:ATP-binding protein [Alphaproteobacteria bacterium]
MIRLPTIKHNPEIDFPLNEIWCLMGAPKSGKTTMASTFPDALLIDVENGGRYIGCYRVIPKNLMALTEIIEELKKDSSRYKSIILDSIDLTSLWVEREICKKKKAESIGSIPYGEGRSLLNTKLISILDDLRSIGKTLVLITHTRDSSGKHSMLLTEALAVYVRGHSGIIAHCYKARERGKVNYLIDLAGSEIDEAGSRHPLLSQITEITNDYNDLVERFNELSGEVEDVEKP